MSDILKKKSDFTFFSDGPGLSGSGTLFETDKKMGVCRISDGGNHQHFRGNR